jgi:hypothetical protein
MLNEASDRIELLLPLKVKFPRASNFPARDCGMSTPLQGNEIDIASKHSTTNLQASAD